MPTGKPAETLAMRVASAGVDSGYSRVVSVGAPFSRMGSGGKRKTATCGGAAAICHGDGSSLLVGPGVGVVGNTGAGGVSIGTGGGTTREFVGGKPGLTDPLPGKTGAALAPGKAGAGWPPGNTAAGCGGGANGFAASPGWGFLLRGVVKQPPAPTNITAARIIAWLRHMETVLSRVNHPDCTSNGTGLPSRRRKHGGKMDGSWGKITGWRDYAGHPRPAFC